MGCTLRLCLLVTVVWVTCVLAASVPASTPKKGSVTTKSAPKPAAKPLVKSTTKVGGVKKGATTAKTVKKVSSVIKKLGPTVPVKTTMRPAKLIEITKMVPVQPTLENIENAPVTTTTLLPVPALLMRILPSSLGASELTYFKAYKKLPPGVTWPPGIDEAGLNTLIDQLGKAGGDQVTVAGGTTPLVQIPDFVKRFLPSGIGAAEVTYAKAYRKLPPGITLPPGISLDMVLTQLDALGI